MNGFENILPDNEPVCCNSLGIGLSTRLTAVIIVKLTP